MARRLDGRVIAALAGAAIVAAAAIVWSCGSFGSAEQPLAAVVYQTDFGLEDGAVCAMKGVARQIEPHRHFLNGGITRDGVVQQPDQPGHLRGKIRLLPRVREIAGRLGELNHVFEEIPRLLHMPPEFLRPVLADERIRILPLRQYVKFNVDSTMRVDLKTRTEVVGAQIADGRMSVDEARALEDRGPVPGGDRYNVPAPKADPTTREGDPL